VNTRQVLRELSGGHPADERRVWFSLAGPDLDPDAVTALTDIRPSRSWRRGDPKPRTGLPYRDGAWLLESGLAASDEFHDHLDALITRLKPSWSAFVELGQRYEATVDVVICCREAQGPLIQLLPDVAAALSDLGATLSFDIYALPADGDVGAPRMTFANTE